MCSSITLHVSFFPIYMNMCIYVYVWEGGNDGTHMYHGVHIEVKGQLEGVGSLFLPCGSQGLNSGHQVLVFAC